METILEFMKISIIVCLTIAVVWQIKQIKNLHDSAEQLHKKIIELSANNAALEGKLRKTEKERDDNGYKIIAMQKALSDFKKSLKVK